MISAEFKQYRHAARRRGASALTYGLLVGLISVVALGAVTSSGDSVDSLFGNVNNSLQAVPGTNAGSASAGSGSAGGGCSSASSPQSFGFTGSVDQFIVPAGVSNISVKMWGAGGGGSSWNSVDGTGVSGGAGGYVSANIAVAACETLFVIVGEGGSGGPYALVRAPNSFGGGGEGGNGYDSGGANLGSGGAGGGLSGLFHTGVPANPADFAAADPADLDATHANAIVIAAGGGGGSRVSPSHPGQGGNGGGTSGALGYGWYGSTGPGTQSAGGSFGSSGYSSYDVGAADGGKLFGGTAHTVREAASYIGGAGGGGGYYGGGGGGIEMSGGGGSSYIGGPGVQAGAVTSGIPAASSDVTATVLPPNASDPDRSGTSAEGGAGGNGGSTDGFDGGDGLIIISW